MKRTLALRAESLAPLSPTDLAGMVGGVPWSGDWELTCAVARCVDDLRTATRTLFCDAPTTMC